MIKDSKVNYKILIIQFVLLAICLTLYLIDPLKRGLFPPKLIMISALTANAILLLLNRSYSQWLTFFVSLSLIIWYFLA